MNELYNEFLTELIEEKLLKLRKISHQYCDGQSRKLRLSTELEKVKKKLSNDEAKILDDYISEIILLSDTECKFLILQGFVDGLCLIDSFKTI